MDGSGGSRFASQWACSLALAVVSRHEFCCARPRACSLARSVVLCHELCCLHSRACSRALAATPRRPWLGGMLPIESKLPAAPLSLTPLQRDLLPGSSSARNFRPLADRCEAASLTFRVACQCACIWHHRQQRHKHRLGKSAAETISSIAHCSSGRPGIQRGAG